MALWTPSYITTALWLDATDSDTLTLDGSSNVEQWDDKSGNNLHFSQGTQSYRPVIGTAAINSMDVVRFDGSDDYLGTPSMPTGESAYSIYAVLQVANDPPTAAGSSGIWAFRATSDVSHHPYTDGELYHSFGSTSRRTFSPGKALDSPHLFNIDSEAGSWIARLSGSAIHSDGSNTVGIGTAGYVGTSDISGAKFFEGDFAEIILFTEVLSESDRQKIEGYLAHKWGLEANLPSDHPYKASAPTTETIWNPDDKGANITLSNGNLTATSTSTTWTAVRATDNKSSGKWYFEIRIDVAADNWQMLGVGTSSATLSDHVGSDTHSYAYAGEGGSKSKYHNDINSTYGDSFTAGDIIGVALDLDNGKIWFSKNGTWQNSGDPESGTNEAFSGISGTFFPMHSLYTNTNAGTARFTSDDCSYAPPSGFSHWFPDGQRATGGTITVSGDYIVHTFTENDDFVVTEGGDVEYLIVAGGGGGGSNRGSGGGAGGALSSSATVSVATYAITVGAGGVGGPNASRGDGSPGGDSSIAGIDTATGGGKGVGNNVPGGNGGSGGGGDGVNGTAGGSGIAGQGYDGGAGDGSSTSAGGGGGAGAVGSAADATGGGDGGDGIESSINGTATYYAGGGGGGGRNDPGGVGGLGGGGDGAGESPSNTAAQNGTANTGGGGGGGTDSNRAGGSGGSGIVIIRYVGYAGYFSGYFSGYVYELGSPVQRGLFLHDRPTGSLVDSTTSSGNGYYYLETTYSGSHYIVCLDDPAGEDYNDLIIGNVYPEEVV